MTSDETVHESRYLYKQIGPIVIANLIKIHHGSVINSIADTVYLQIIIIIIVIGRVTRWFFPLFYLLLWRKTKKIKYAKRIQHKLSVNMMTNIFHN